MTVVLGPLLVDAQDPAVVTRFWEAALGETACRRHLVIQSQRRAKEVKNRVHLDVYVHDVAPLLALGARVLADYPSHRRATLADVEGNEFCAFIDQDRSDAGPPAEVFAVCTASDRPEEAAAWWAQLLGAEIGPGPDGTMRWLYGSAGRPDLIWKFVRVHDERVLPNRWRWSVTSGRDELVGAGASIAGDDLLVDFDGNEVSAPARRSSAG